MGCKEGLCSVVLESREERGSTREYCWHSTLSTDWINQSCVPPPALSRSFPKAASDTASPSSHLQLPHFVLSTGAANASTSACTNWNTTAQPISFTLASREHDVRGPPTANASTQTIHRAMGAFLSCGCTTCNFDFVPIFLANSSLRFRSSLHGKGGLGRNIEEGRAGVHVSAGLEIKGVSTCLCGGLGETDHCCWRKEKLGARGGGRESTRRRRVVVVFPILPPLACDLRTNATDDYFLMTLDTCSWSRWSASGGRDRRAHPEAGFANEVRRGQEQLTRGLQSCLRR